MKLNGSLAAILLFILVLNTAVPTFAQTDVFEKLELLVPNGKKINEKDVRLRFLEDKLQIEAISDGSILKSFKYSDIKSAEYSYSKNPRWKTGLGLGAASFVFPPILLIAIPLGFSKHRRHWLTIGSEGDYAVLKLSKQYRKLILPAFEAKTGVEVKGTGENK